MALIILTLMFSSAISVCCVAATDNRSEYVAAGGPPQEVHQYWSGSAFWSLHFPPAWPNEDDQTNKYGPPFYAYGWQAPGTSLVHLYNSTYSSTPSWSWHFPPALTDEVDQTNKYGPPFYAFNDTVQGLPLVEIRSYWRGSWNAHAAPRWPGEQDMPVHRPFYAFSSQYCPWPTPLKVGKWVLIGSNNDPTNFTFKQGTTTSSTAQQTQSWARKITSSVEEGFTFQGIGAKASVSSQPAETMGSSFSQTFSQYTKTSFTISFPAGAYWQFHFLITDSCGLATAKGFFVAHTAHTNLQPCCLPGYNVDSEYQSCTEQDAALPGCGQAIKQVIV